MERLNEGWRPWRQLLKKGNEPYLVLLAWVFAHRAPDKKEAKDECLYSSWEARKPYVPNRSLVVEREEEQRWKQKVNFDRLHRAWDLSPALPRDLVWIPDWREQWIVGNEIAPRSYKVETPAVRSGKTEEIYFASQLRTSRLQNQRVTTLTQMKWTLMTGRSQKSQEKGCRHHQLIPFGGVVVWHINLIVMTHVLVQHLEKGGCSGFLHVLKCVYWTYTGYISLYCMAICMNVQMEYRSSTHQIHGVAFQAKSGKVYT